MDAHTTTHGIGWLQCGHGIYLLEGTMYAEYYELTSDNIMVCRESDDNDVSVYAIIVALYSSIDFIVDDLSDLEFFGNDCAGYELTINGRSYIVNSIDEREMSEHGRVVLEPTE